MFGKPREPRKLLADRRAFVTRKPVPLYKRGQIRAAGEGARLGSKFCDIGWLVGNLAMVPRCRRHRRQVDDISHFVARHFGLRAEIQDRGNQDNSVECNVIIAALELVRDGRGTRGPVTLAAQKLWTVPATIFAEPLADEIADRLGVGSDTPVAFGLGFAECMAKSRADRIDKDNVSNIEERIGVGDDGIGRRPVIPCIAWQRNALRPERAHVQPERSRSRTAVEQEGDRAGRVVPFLDIGG